ncbi:MAG TPA: fibronectin type III domain-containing protein [Gemmatimonadales bacterium]
MFNPVGRRAMLAIAIVVSGAACGDSVTEPETPDTPAGLQVAQLTLTSVRITWNSVTGVEGYRLERAAADDPGVFDQIGAGDLTDTTYDDTGLTAGVSYSYRVAAVAGGLTSDYTAAATIATGVAAATLTGNITADRTLMADSLYTLSGFVKVQNGATLTIEPGTRIVGDPSTPGSSLWILRGAKIEAVGTAAEPIVFTSAKPVGSRAPGDWGGLILIGRGRINRTGGPINTEGPTPEDYSGGNDDADGSGTLRYVRVEFAGFDVSAGGGQELNSISAYATGSGTRFEYVQSMSGLDDSFEFWGGAAQGRYLISFESGDDHFDWSEGFRGKLQFIIGFQSQRLVPAPGAGSFSSDPRGFEGDGCEPGLAGCTLTDNSASTPYSNPTIANFTLVGTGDLSGFPDDGRGMVLRRGTAGLLSNGVVARFKGVACQMRDAWTDSLRLRDSLNLNNIIFADNTGGNYADPAANGSNDFCKAASWAGSNHIESAMAAAEIFTSLNAASLDFTPASPGAVALGAGAIALPAARAANFFGGTMATTTYAGAADPSAATPWWAGWSTYLIN